MTFWPRSLLGHTLATISATLLTFTLIFVSAAIFFVYNPMAKRHADDFAALVVSAAHSLQSLPEEMHAELKRQLSQDHGLIVAEESVEMAQAPSDLAYYPFFHEAVERRVGCGRECCGGLLGFDGQRVGINPPGLLILAVSGGALLTLLASLFEVRRVVRPLGTLSSAVKAIVRGHSPGRIPEDGPDEIASLARAFNRMSLDLQQLSENRTVMIAGISHDLRTPLTRLGLAVEMLDEKEEHQSRPRYDAQRYRQLGPAR